MSIFQKIVIVAVVCTLGAAMAQSLSAYTLHADSTIEIRGQILSNDTEEPIIGAHVRLQQHNLVTITDETGTFQFVVDAGETHFTIRITHIGYRPKLRVIQLPDFHENPVIRMLPASEMMSPLTVISNRPLNAPSSQMEAVQGTFLPVDSGAFLRNAGNASGIRRGGFGIDPVIRGLSGSRLNIRVDGLATTAAACPNRMDPPTSHIRLSDIERVEIHRGPHALQYGPSFGGTVNFIRQQPKEYTSFRLNGDVRAGYETNTGHRKTDMRLIGGASKWDFMLNGGYSSTDDYTSGSGEAVRAGFNSFDIGAEAGYKLSDSQRIYGGWSQSVIRDADFPALGMDMAMDDTYKVKAGYKWTPLTPMIVRSFEVNTYWSLVDHEMNNHNRPEMFAMRDAVALAETETFGLNTKINGLLSSGTWTVAAGLDQQDVNGTRFVTVKMGPQMGNQMTYNLWQDASITNAGLFAGTEHFIDTYTLTFGARVDYNFSTANDPAPRFVDTDVDSEHLNFSVSGGVTKTIGTSHTFGLFLGRGVRSPDITERYINFLAIGQDGFEYAGNPDLKPEANNQVDLVWQADTDRFSLNATLFTSYQTNYISAERSEDVNPVGAAPGVRLFSNRGDALFTGFEWTISTDFSTKWFARWDASYTRAEYRDTKTPVAEIPPFETALTVGGFAFSDKLSHEFSVKRVFPQPRYDELFGESRTPGFWLVDASMRAEIFNGLMLSGGIKNLLNESYYEHLNRRFNPTGGGTSEFLPEPGRRLFLELSVNF